MLKLEQIDVYYGNVRALENVDFEVDTGEIVTLIGANGAGKSTILKTISGLNRPRQGSITFVGENIERMAVERIVSRGISHVPEGRRIFPGLTVFGNLEVATSSWRKRGESYQREMENVFQLFPQLREKKDQLGWSLSGGEQQILSIGRGLMSRPRLLLLDEPSLGLAPKLVRLVFDTIKTINDQGTTILLVEQNAYAALQIADRGYVLENGRIALFGLAKDLASDEKVKKAYLGG
ncbi:MAG: ABC transporter ATP-binding protein [Deltaproteobacteria bacterium]|nr:ABC transporter ATP-binding protein [Deltaproteobacteria bacterium]MBW2339391.1 ABC transporter ATP-binding protein [Deltaproteobacteria bacterium]